MDKAKQKRLEAAGWTVGTAAEFLGLSDEEAIVEMRLRIRDSVQRTGTRLE